MQTAKTDCLDGTSHASDQKPTISTLVALVALTIVARTRPAWLAVTLSAAATAEHVRPEKISRLATTVLPVFKKIITEFTQRGRPRKERAESTMAIELAITQAILQVASGILSQLSWKRRSARDLVVGAWLRISAAHPGITQDRFATSIAIPVRTLRNWLQHPLAPPRPQSPNRPKPRPPTPPERKRNFGFGVVLPETQFGSDTTDLQAFGMPLKLIAAQDIGGRDRALFDKFRVSEQESSDLVAEVFAAALKQYPGAQMITDQGTPYLAEKSRAALEALEVEHAPQKEGDPTGKATVERGFGQLKNLARPLLSLTDRIATQVPALRDAPLAQAAATLIVKTVFDAYQAGSRAARRAFDARAGMSEERLVALASESREQARATERSKRLFLEHIHAIYQLGGSCKRFVRALRKYPLEALHEAEQRFRAVAPRNDIRNPARYLAAILRNCAQVTRARHRAEARDREMHSERRALAEAKENQSARDQADPIDWLARGLRLVGMQWYKGQLLGGGRGMGLAAIRGALGRLLELHGVAMTSDMVSGVFQRISLTEMDRLGPDELRAVRAVLEQEMSALMTSALKHECPSQRVRATFARPGETGRPPPIALSN